MNIKAFFVTALSGALELGIATADDVLRHVTPDLLAQHLPRPLWARLLTACIGAPKVDPQLIVETVGVSNLCEHIPTTTIWELIADVAGRSLGNGAAREPVPLTASKGAGPSFETRTPAKPLSIGSPPPPETRPTPTPPPAARGPSIPAPKDAAITVGLDDVVAELAAEEVTAPPTRARTATGNRFRQSSTNIGRLAAASQQQRRPQAAVPAAPTGTESATERPVAKTARRGETEIEVEVETDVRNADDWRTALAVEDEQLVDWSSSDEPTTTTEGDTRKR
ncbi:MAG: hypothetical protein H0T46_04610 [Deltaproteobacteria bacterium]|nr:hypothetical protein [Deltaproteobacteria bacterium]